MRRLLVTLCCATTVLTAQQTRARIGLPGYKDMFPIEDVTLPFTLDAPPARSYAAVKAAFADLKVPVEVDDSAGGIVGTQKTQARINFAGYKLSRLFDCGTRPMGGANADSFRITMVFLALLDADGVNRTKLRVGFVGGGEPVGGSAREAVVCSSSGVIEAKLVELASTHLK